MQLTCNGKGGEATHAGGNSCHGVAAPHLNRSADTSDTAQRASAPGRRLAQSCPRARVRGALVTLRTMQSTIQKRRGARRGGGGGGCDGFQIRVRQRTVGACLRSGAAGALWALAVRRAGGLHGSAAASARVT